MEHIRRIVKYGLSIGLFMSCSLVWAQQQKIYTHQGNKDYGDKKYEEAQQKYEEAIKKDPKYRSATFNLGNAQHRQAQELLKQAEKAKGNKTEEQKLLKQSRDLNMKAAKNFASAAELSKNDNEKEEAYYNQGNAHLEAGQLPESIQSYENALKLNPNDNNARYNLAYAIQLMKQQQKKQQQKQSKQNQQQQQQKQNQQQQQKSDKKKNDEQKQQQQSEQELSKKDAEMLLDALNEQEKKTQDKLRKKMHPASRVKPDKDW